MFSPRQRASFIDSKIVSMVASACFCVMPRLDTRMLMRSLFSIAGTLPWQVGEPASGSGHLHKSAAPCKRRPATSCDNASAFWWGRPALQGGQVDPAPGLELSTGVGVSGQKDGVDLREVVRGERCVEPVRRPEAVAPQRRRHLTQRELGRVACRAPAGALPLVN